jgi:hypothetical protein
MIFMLTVFIWTNRGCEFHKRGQHLIGVHNVTLSIIPMRLSNPDCLPFGIHGCDTAQL